MKNGIQWFIGLVVVSVCTLGCGDSGPVADLIEVEAQVTLDGKPVEGIQVTMLPDISKENDGPSSIGSSGSDGAITFRTLKGNKVGLVAGAHIATAVDEKEVRSEDAKVTTRILPKYATAKGGVKVEVQEGQKLIINFKSK